MASLDLMLAALRAQQIQTVVVRLSGGGDEGSAEYESIETTDGGELRELPRIVIDFNDNGGLQILSEELLIHAENAPNIDWVNNEGGYGTVSYFPFKEITVEIDVMPNASDEDEEYWDAAEDQENEESEKDEKIDR